MLQGPFGMDTAPVIARGETIVIGSNGAIYAIRPNGTILWQLNAG
jgi:outer membrane protein assembly factor BamB